MNAIVPAKSFATNIWIPRGRSFQPSGAASPEGNAIDAKLWNLTTAENATSTFSLPPTHAPISNQTLFETRLTIKVLVASVAMHIADEWRRSIFKQLDDLLDLDEWDPEEPLPRDNSVRTFLRLITFERFRKRPSLAFIRGHVLATWITENERITIECLGEDEVRWVLALVSPPRSETASGICTIKRLPFVLSPWRASEWLLHDRK